MIYYYCDGSGFSYVTAFPSDNNILLGKRVAYLIGIIHSDSCMQNCTFPFTQLTESGLLWAHRLNADIRCSVCLEEPQLRRLRISLISWPGGGKYSLTEWRKKTPNFSFKIFTYFNNWINRKNYFDFPGVCKRRTTEPIAFIASQSDKC